MMAANSQVHQQQRKLVNFPGAVVSGGSGDPRSNQNTLTYPRNISSASASGAQKNVAPSGTFILTSEHSPFIENPFELYSWWLLV